MRSDTSGRGAALTHVVYYKVATTREPSGYRWRFLVGGPRQEGCSPTGGLDGNRLSAGNSGRVRRYTPDSSRHRPSGRVRATRSSSGSSASGRARLASPRGWRSGSTWWQCVVAASRPRWPTSRSSPALPAPDPPSRAPSTAARSGNWWPSARRRSPRPGRRHHRARHRGRQRIAPALGPSTGRTFYVATTGSDSNPGTLGAPWRTVQKALNALQPGSAGACPRRHLRREPRRGARGDRRGADHRRELPG